ncbi:hypothetical protein [Anaerotruncus rubiinfantis]
MNAKEAVARRIIELCNGRNMAVNALGNLAGVSPDASCQGLFYQIQK